MISPQAIHELKEAAEAAETDFDRVQISVGGGMRATKTVPAFIAAANPERILSLIEENERMREALSKISNRMIRGSTATRQDVQDVARSAQEGV